VAIASGGRYDALVGRFCRDPRQAAGTGFGFHVEAIRDLLGAEAPGGDACAPWLVAAAGEGGLPAALARMAELHRSGEAAELCAQPCTSQAEAAMIAAERGCRGAIWLAA
jgi:ATP phosphoribosyltransferase regulatory subunit